jgi:hypothetical protein
MQRAQGAAMRKKRTKALIHEENFFFSLRNFQLA